MPFIFTKTQRYAVVLMVAVILVLQAALVFGAFVKPKKEARDNQQLAWETHQFILDSIQKRNDSIKKTPKPFNPNYLSDYKWYLLGLSPKEIDRLHAFRKMGKFLKSPQEFQQITHVSDSLLIMLKPYFKFPEFKQKGTSSQDLTKPIQRMDVNTATIEELLTIPGIGKVRSERIIKVRKKLGGFYDVGQLGIVYGLPEELVENLKKYLFVDKENVYPQPLNINRSSLQELMLFPYFDYQLSKEIITYRTMHGNDIGIEDLYNINGFPHDKVDIIALYLQF